MGEARARQMQMGQFLRQLTRLAEEFGVACPIQPETVLARTFCNRIQHRLDFTEVASGVDYDNPQLFPPHFREEAYWQKLLRCTGSYPNVLSGITVFRFHARSKTNRAANLTEITITLPLFLIMRLCAAGDGTAQENKRSLIQGSCNFMPLQDDCRRIQQVAVTLLGTIQRQGRDKGRDLSHIHGIIEEGLFNTRIGTGGRQEQPPGNIQDQGISIYITSLPVNLFSGLTQTEQDVSLQFDGDIRHLLTDTHPLYINERTMYWDRPLRDLIWNPPDPPPWMESWAFPSHTHS